MTLTFYPFLWHHPLITQVRFYLTFNMGSQTAKIGWFFSRMGWGGESCYIVYLSHRTSMHTRPIINNDTLWDPLGGRVVCFRQGILLIWGDLGGFGGAHEEANLHYYFSLFSLQKRYGNEIKAWKWPSWCPSLCSTTDSHRYIYINQWITWTEGC